MAFPFCEYRLFAAIDFQLSQLRCPKLRRDKLFSELNDGRKSQLGL